jgi:hypothetical protein
VLVLFAFVVGTIVSGTHPIGGPSSLLFPLVFLLLVVMMFVCAINWVRTFFVADEVLDVGDHLIVRKGATSTRVPLADIESVSEFPLAVFNGLRSDWDVNVRLEARFGSCPYLMFNSRCLSRGAASWTI